MRVMRWLMPVTAAVVVAGSVTAGGSVAHGAGSAWEKTAEITPGTQVREAVANPGTDTVLLATGSEQVLVVDGRTHAVTGSVRVPGVGVERLVDDPDRNLVYGLGTSGRYLVVIDASINQPAYTLTLPFAPSGIAVDTATHTVYLTSGRSLYRVTPDTGATSAVAEADTELDEVTVNPHTHTVWASGLLSTMTVNPATGAVTPVLTGTASSHVTVDPATDTGYVTAADRHSVLAIDEASGATIATIPSGALPLRSSLGVGELFVTDDRDNTVTVIDTATHTVTGTVPVAARPWWVAVSPDGATAFVSTGTGMQVDVLNKVTTPHILTPALPQGRVGVAYAAQLQADTHIDTWRITHGALPAGLTLDSHTGQITGTPQHAATMTVTVAAENAAGTGTRTYPVTVTTQPDMSGGNGDSGGGSSGRHLPVVSG